MNVAMNAELNTGLPALSSQRDARRWIERQLRWERTLGALRGKENHPARQAA